MEDLGKVVFTYFVKDEQNPHVEIVKERSPTIKELLKELDRQVLKYLRGIFVKS